MKASSCTRILSIITLIFSTAVTITQPSYGESNKFFCGINRNSYGRGIPATFVRTSGGTSLVKQNIFHQENQLGIFKLIAI